MTPIPKAVSVKGISFRVFSESRNGTLSPRAVNEKMSSKELWLNVIKVG